jgi:ubiquitin-activating enzyme E1 C
VKITPHCFKIQERSKEWYKQFNLVIAGLDNIAARRWLNKTLNDIVEFDDEGQIKAETVIPLIDGGTEAFMGQSRVFFPKKTSCFECSTDTLAVEQKFHSCTIANVPRIPEHCIQVR